MKCGLKNIAILGATGHIAKSLIYNFKDEQAFALHLFTRSMERTKTFSQLIEIQNVVIKNYSQFNDFEYSCIINCVGIGDPTMLKSQPDEIFFITEEIDLLAIRYLKNHPQTTYINFSSGAVYGKEFNTSVNDNSIIQIAVNNLLESDFYGIAKINAEAKHRSLKDLNIIDLRIFGYYSQFIDLDKPYLICEIIRSIKTKKSFITSPSDIIRDYIHPIDLADLVKHCMEDVKLNIAFDVCSKNPISKFELLSYFKNSYNLKYKIKNNTKIISATGNKDNYFSESKKITFLGFEPSYSSLDSIKFVTHNILTNPLFSYKLPVCR